MVYSHRTLLRALTLAPLLLACLACAQTSSDKTEPAPASAAKEKTTTAGPSKADVQQSQKLYQRAMRLTTNATTMPEAFGLLEESTTLDPTNIATATAKEFVRQELVTEHMESGNRFMEKAQAAEAAAQFEEASALDPTNAYATQRLNDARSLAKGPYATPVFDFADQPVLAPKPGKQNFTYRGDSRQFLTNVGRAFGIDVTFDGSYSPKQIKVNLEQVDFNTALNVACKMSHCFHITNSPHAMVIANDTTDTRRNLERTSLKTFYIPAEGSAQSLTEIVSTIRTLLDLRYIIPDTSANTVTIRASKQDLDAVAMIIDNVTAARPQVMLEIRVLRLGETAAKQIGVNYPLQYTLFNLNTAAQQLGPDAQGLIQRFLNGTLTPQDLAAAAALLSSGALANSPLTQGFATFGGGTFKSGIVIPPASVNFGMNRSLVTSVEHVMLRATQGQAATFQVGDRIPVITATFSPILNVPGITSAANAQPIIPSFNYEDLGVILKTTPHITGTGEISLQLDLAIKALEGTSINNIPTISNRQFTGTITVRNGETSLVAGTVDRNNMKSLSGVPWLSSLPGLGKAFSTTNDNVTSDELLVLITPHIIQLGHDPASKTELFLSAN